MKDFLRDVDNSQLEDIIDEEENINFNEDLLCEHNSLRSLDSKRKIVPERVWETLKTYFPHCKEYLSTAPACFICEVYLYIYIYIY